MLCSMNQITYKFDSKTFRYLVESTPVKNIDRSNAEAKTTSICVTAIVLALFCSVVIQFVWLHFFGWKLFSLFDVMFFF